MQKISGQEQCKGFAEAHVALWGVEGSGPTVLDLTDLFVVVVV